MFGNVLLADEINRATPKTQSALLESMEERQVTLDGVTHPLPTPFIVLATQNPVEFAGTFPLPEAQLDRFTVRISLRYLQPRAEMEMLDRFNGADPLADLKPVTDAATLAAAQLAITAVHVAEQVKAYIVQLVGATRQHSELSLGPARVPRSLSSASASARRRPRPRFLPPR